MTPRIRAVVLDMDGLILDTEPMSQTGWVRTFRERNLHFREDQFHELVGLNVPDAREKILSWYGQDFPFEEVYARKRVHVDEIIAAEGIALKPGLPEFLAAVEELGLAKAIATSTGRERALYKLARVGLEGRFSALACGDEVERGKPAPDCFLLAARRLGIPPEECVALDDSDPGAVSAAAAGMRVLVIPDVKPPSPETLRLAWRVLPDLHHAAELLRREVTPPP